MKIYTFPYGGSFGKGDTWDGENDVELTDEEAIRLEASARKEPRWHLDEDPEISDIHDKVYEFLYNHDIEMLMNDKYWIEEQRSDREYEGLEPVSDRELAEEYMEGTSFHVCYPEELQDLEEESEEESEEDKIETTVWRPMFGVPGLEFVIGRKLKQQYYDEAVQDNRFHICLLKTAGDPVVAYFGLDRKIINLSGGGTYIMKEKDGKTVREWMPFDLDTLSVKREVNRFLEEVN